MVSPINEPGFLTRIVNRIREATQEVLQSEGETTPAESSAEAVRQQKRRDDAIRRREFNHLRVVRAQRLQSHPEMVVRMSTFQNSSTFNGDGRSLRGRAKTVKKINAIEAELAQQWWSNSNSEATPTRLPDEPAAPAAINASNAPKVQSNAVDESEMDLDFTGLAYETTLNATPTIAAAGPATVPPQYVPTLPMGDALGAAMDLFEQGQFDKAEAALATLLQSPQLDDTTAEACSAALLNLYRTTGARANFDTVAIEYAQLFGRSAPEWRSSVLVDGADSLMPTADDSRPHQTWECPAHLGSVDMVALQALSGSTASTVFDWAGLQAVEADAAQALCAIFSNWAAHKTVLHFRGTEALQATLHAATPVADHTADAMWWRLRLEVLRVLGLQEAFDDAAVDYCVTYEISPPAWAPARCSVVLS